MTHSNGPRRLPAFAFLLFFWFACGGGDGEPGTSPTDGGGGSRDTVGGSSVDPCALLSPGEWAPLMEGLPVVEARSATAPGIGIGMSRCDWTYNEGGTATGIRRQWANIGVSVAAAYGPSTNSVPIALGDGGYLLANDTARTLDMGWKKGASSASFKYSVLFVPLGKTWPELRDAAIALAGQAAARMP